MISIHTLFYWLISNGLSSLSYVLFVPTSYIFLVLIGSYLTLLVDCTSFFLFPLVGYFFVEFFPRFLLKSFCLNPFILLELCIYSFEFFSFSFIMEFFLLYFILIPLLEFLQINFFLSVLFVCFVCLFFCWDYNITHFIICQ